MIIIVHSLYFLVKHLVKIYRTAKAIENFRTCQIIGNEVRIHTNCIITDSLDLRFDPPLYKQRYATVQQILLNVNWKSRIKKVVEFGCSEFNFFIYLKHLFDIREIIFVDVDENTLDFNLFKVHPLTTDYLKKRPDPLKVQVLIGSVCQPDAKLLGCDAVIAIELIEHLYPDTLEALPYNVFHYIKPLLAIFTTPNYEFNVLFPDTKKFRHPDHKFEWTREQFQSWALNITTRFPNYTVQFDGIGPGPKESESIGCCSQIAIFLRHSEEVEQLSEVPKSCREIQENEQISNVETHDESYGICTYYSYVKQIEKFNTAFINEPNNYYKEIENIIYPFHIDNRSPEERLFHEIQYKIYSSASSSSRFYNEEKDRIEYPLYDLVSNDEGYFTTVPELQKLLQKEHLEVEECFPFGSDEKSLCVVYNLRMENHSSSPSSDGNGSDDNNTYEIPWNIAADESDWDAEYNKSVKVNNDPLEHGQVVKEDNIKNDNNVNTSEQKVTYQFHSTLPNTSIESIESKDEFKVDRSSIPKRQTNSHSKLPSTSKMHNTDKIPKKGTNIKNKDMHISSQGSSKESDNKKRKVDSSNSNIDNNDKKSYKKNVELKVRDSTHSQGSSIPKSVRTTKNSNSSGGKGSSKSKIMATTSLKRFPIKSDDSSMPSTSDIKKKKKCKKNDDDKDDIKSLTECIIYNTLNNIPEVDENASEPSTSSISNNVCKNENAVSEVTVPANAVAQNIIVHEIVDQIVTNTHIADSNKSSPDTDEKKCKDLTSDTISQELNHASREALFDPNSETDMLEEFEIPPAPPAPPALEIPPVAQHHNVILIGLNIHNDEDSVVLPENADPFPNWLLQLLGANVEGEGESHDEPHFYCQGDGIGVHPSIIEVEIDEEESTSDSSSSHDEAEAEHTISDSGVVPLPTDDADDDQSTLDDSTIADISLPLNVVTPGSTSAAESADEFFDVEETLTLHDRQNTEINKRI